MAAISMTLERNTAIDKLQSGYVAANIISISGTNFGPPPPIVHYEDYSLQTAGDSMSLTNTGIGNNYSLDNLQPKIIAAWGRNGISNRQGGTDATPVTGDNKPCSVYALLTAKKNFFIAYDMAVPSGRSFSATSPSTSTLPAVSAIKPVWLFDGPSDSATKADLVIGSWIGASFNLLGNQSTYNIYGTSNFDFSGWNHYQAMAIAGTPDPFVNNGEALYTTSNAVDGTQVHTQTNIPAFGDGATAAQYDRVYIPAWAGPDSNQDNALHVISYLYIAMADDDSVKARIELTRNSAYLSSSENRLLDFLEWTDTNIVFDVKNLRDQGYTHYRVTTQTGQTLTGAIPAA